MPPTQVNPNDPDVIALSKAIIQHESGGDFNAVGDAGTSHGAAQWQPETWKAQAQDILGDPNAQMTPENQKAVLAGSVAKDKAAGLNPAQIAAKWNSGSPDGWENKIGVATINGQRVPYNVPKYVKDVTDLYQQYKGQAQPNSNNLITPPAPVQSYQAPPDQPQQTQSSDPSLGDQINNRIGEASTALGNAATGKINPLSGIIQTAGAAGGLVGDVTNDALGLIPGVKQAEGLLGKGVGALANTQVGQKVVGAGENFSQAHPELAGDIGAAGNILGAVGSFEGLGAAKDVIGGAIGKAVGKDALAPIIEDISPTLGAGTKAGASDVLSNGTTKSGLFGTVTRTPDPEMAEAASVVKEAVPKFSKLGTFSEKVGAVQDGIENYAKELETNLSKGEVQPILTHDDINALQASIDKQVVENPFLTGEDGVQAQKIFTQFKKFLPQDRDVTMSDVLAARKKLDSWIKSQKGPGVLDPAKETQVSLGLRAVRQGANNLMKEKVPEANVKALLRKQSLLYKVAENMAPKASKEVGSNVFTRAAQAHPRITGLIKKGTGLAVTGAGLGEAQHLLGGK